MSVLIGHDTDTGEQVRIDILHWRSGFYVLGKPGVGKSNLLANLAHQALDQYHPVFFLDPHGDAIANLLQSVDEINDRIDIIPVLFDPEDPTHSFGINLLACDDITNLKERTDTYTKAYNVFHKLWENEWGPWLQLILQNTLYVFIENQEYTLAEVPLFLIDERFRTHLVERVRYNAEAVDFWTYRFGAKRHRDQEAQVDAALTRFSTFLGHPYVKHIVGQQKNTINFNNYLGASISDAPLVAFRLSAHLALDIKKFIGTMLISELLHAVRTRPLEIRRAFALFVDEFQHFATEQFADFILEGRKYGCAITIAHQERAGQLRENQRILGATMACANKVIFQVTPRDAQELAPEFALSTDEWYETQERPVVLSPKPVEAIWERGHPDKQAMEIRQRYFWIVDLLHAPQSQTYFQFHPDQPGVAYVHGPESKVNWYGFSDQGQYRATRDMIQTGIGLLNAYYHTRMQEESADRPPDVHDLQLFYRVIENLGGVLGFRRVMQCYIPQELRQAYADRITYKIDKDRMQLINFEYLGRTGPSYAYESIGDIPYYIYNEADIDKWKNLFAQAGFTSQEIGDLVEWELRKVDDAEQSALRDVIDVTFASLFDEKRKADIDRVYTHYGYTMSGMAVVHAFDGLDIEVDVTEKEKTDLWKMAIGRDMWNLTELTNFLLRCFRILPLILTMQPVKVPGGHYEERREKTQADLMNEMAQKLANLPRFTAYAKLFQEHEGREYVGKGRVSIPFYDEKCSPEYYEEVKKVGIENAHLDGMEREQIEHLIRQRQAPWRQPQPTPQVRQAIPKRPAPPADEPPPASF